MSDFTIYANSIFEQPWWLDIVAPGQWDEVFVYGEGKDVVARLPYAYKKGKIFLPNYTQTLGIWMSDTVKSFQRGNYQYSEQKEIIHELLKKIPFKSGVDIVLDSALQYVLPFRWEGYEIEPTFSYRIKNLSDIKEVESNFSKKIKRDINRGIRGLVLDDSSNSIKEFIELQNHTYKRQNRRNPINNSFTQDVIRKAIVANHGKLMIARDSDGKPHAGSFLLYDEKVCYHLMSGQDTSFGNDCAMPFLFHHEINFARSVSKAFDFEGSMVEGIEQVYRRYGGEQVINWHISKQSILSDVRRVLKPRIKRLIGYKI